MHGSDGAVEILLKVPAQATQCSLVRSGVVAIAQRREMPQDQTDEVCFAIEEAFMMLLSCSDSQGFGDARGSGDIRGSGDDSGSGDARIDIRFLLGPESFQAEIARSDKTRIPAEVVKKFKQAVALAEIALSVKPSRGWVSLTTQTG